MSNHKEQNQSHEAALMWSCLLAPVLNYSGKQSQSHEIQIVHLLQKPAQTDLFFKIKKSVCLTTENKITVTSLHSSLVVTITNYSGQQIKSHEIQIVQKNKKSLTHSIEEQTFLTIDACGKLSRLCSGRKSSAHIWPSVLMAGWQIDWDLTVPPPPRKLCSSRPSAADPLTLSHLL